MDWQTLWQTHHRNLEDFWNRRGTLPHITEEFSVFGQPVLLRSNDERARQALAISLPLFSRVPPFEKPPFTLQIAVVPAVNLPGPPPTHLMQHTWYTGDSQWLMIHLGAWGHGHIDMGRGEATVVIAPELAALPELLSRCVLNTILLNFCLGNEYAMLHASCLYREGKTLLLIAPHNTGKSTTALHLMQAGFRLVSDSMMHIVPGPTGLLAGFPVGRIKLRQDMLPQFAQYQPYLEAEPVREETKYTLNLRQIAPHMIWEDALLPGAVELCLLQRHNRDESILSRAKMSDVWATIMQNSLFFDTPQVWGQNLTQIEVLLRRARVHHLTIGRDVPGLVATVETLWRM